MALSISTVLERTQMLLHDLHQLAVQDNAQFNGVVLAQVVYTPPEGEQSLWRVTVEREPEPGDTEVPGDEETVIPEV